MGAFGQVEGHRDELDSAGSFTCMISNSRLPPDYEHGRFHLLALGLYVKLKPSMVSNFCGLNKHGGSPPIAPKGQRLSPHAYRLMNVCYPPHTILSCAGHTVTPFASLPKDLLTLGPEITTHQ